MLLNKDTETRIGEEKKKDPDFPENQIKRMLYP